MIRKPSPIPRPLAVPLEPLYAWAVARRNRRFDRGKEMSRAPVFVISVGNISVGGAGKSPHCQLLARLCKKLGKNPAIVLRGYGPKEGGVSDELAEHRQRSPDVPAAADPDRLAAIAHLITGQVPGAGVRRPDVVILDDGFQHRRLKRDLDLVLIDSTRSPFADRLLPAGWLREPVTALARASAVVLTRADLPPSRELQTLRDDVARVTGAPPLAETAHAWEPEIPALVSGRETTKPKGWLKGRRVVAACAIGNPSAFESQLAAAGARVAETVAFRDPRQARRPRGPAHRRRRPRRRRRRDRLHRQGLDQARARRPGRLALPRAAPRRRRRGPEGPRGARGPRRPRAQDQQKTRRRRRVRRRTGRGRR